MGHTRPELPMRYFTRRLPPLLTLALTTLLTACAGEKTTAPITVASISIASTVTTLQYAQTVQLAAVVTGSNGSALSGRTVSWSSSNDEIATVSPTGLVTAGAVRGGSPETVAITATSEGKSATTSVSIAPISVETITPSLAQLSLYVGQMVQLGVTLRDVKGTTLNGRVAIWSSASPSIATVSSDGVVSAVARGTTTISVTVDGKVAMTNVTVELVPVKAVIISPTIGSLYVGQTQPLSASARDSAGNALTGRVVTWTIEPPAVASISSTGVLTALSTGSAVVTATVEGNSASVTIRITPFERPTLLNLVELEQGEYPETSVAINPRNANNIVVSAPTRHYTTLDGGRTWSRLTALTWADLGPWHDPNVEFDRNGTLFHQGMGIPGGGTPRGLYVGRSANGGLAMASSNISQVYRTSRSLDGEPDQGWLAIDTIAGSPYVDNLYVIFSDYPNWAGTTTGVPSPPCIGFCLRVAVSSDGGRSWSPAIDISRHPGNANGTGPQEHSAGITVGADGEVYATWWRNAVDREWLVFSRSTDGGKTWSADKAILSSHLHNHPNTWPNDAIRHNPTIAVDNGSSPNRGTIYISTGEVIGGVTGSADAWIVRSTDKGATWSDKVRLTDGPLGPFKYAFQPRISIAPTGRIDAAWYDSRNWSGRNTNELSYDIYYSFSKDGARSFSPSVRVTPRTMTLIATCPTQSGCGDRRLLEYMGIASSSNRVAISFNSIWWIPGSPPPKDPYDRRPLAPPTVAILGVNP